VAKDTKLLTVLSNCEHKTYAIADIFPPDSLGDYFANPQGVRKPQVGKQCTRVIWTKN